MQRTLVILLALSVVVFAGCSAEPEKPAAGGEKPTAEGAAGGPGPAGPQKVVPKPEADLTTVDFVKDGLPLLATHCSGCHSGAGAKGGLDLSGIKTKEDAEAMKDKLAKAASLVESRRMPPAKAPQPSKEDQEKLVAALLSL